MQSITEEIKHVASEFKPQLARDAIICGSYHNRKYFPIFKLESVGSQEYVL